MERRQTAGETPRSDFFVEDESGRTTAEELLEEVCRITGDAADERKAPLLGHLYAALVYATDVPPAHARFVYRLVESLTYRQLIALAAIGLATETSSGPFGRQGGELPPDGGQRSLAPDIALELDDLAIGHHLIGIAQLDKREPGEPVTVSAPWALWGSDDTRPIWQQHPERTWLTPRGRQLFDLLGLSDPPPGEIERFVDEAWALNEGHPR
jgi:hypothetical protein